MPSPGYGHGYPSPHQYQGYEHQHPAYGSASGGYYDYYHEDRMRSRSRSGSRGGGSQYDYHDTYHNTHHSEEYYNRSNNPRRAPYDHRAAGYPRDDSRGRGYDSGDGYYRGESQSSSRSRSPPRGGRGAPPGATTSNQHHRQSAVYSAGSAASRTHSDVRSERSSGTAQSTLTSVVGVDWRRLEEKKKKKQSVMSLARSSPHSSIIPRPTGKKLALLFGMDDEYGAAVASCRFVVEFLEEEGYKCERPIIDAGQVEGEEEQCDVDIETGVAEMIALARAGDALFVYAINYRSQRRSISSILHTFAENLQSGVRLTVMLDSCTLTSKPAFAVNHSQERVQKPATAGLTTYRRLATQKGAIAQAVKADIIVFNGENPHDVCATHKTQLGHRGCYTSAVINAFRDPAIRPAVGKFLGQPPSFAALSQNIPHKLENIYTGRKRHNINSEIVCVKAYDIDQPAWV